MKRWYTAASALAATLVAGAFAWGFRPAAAEGFRPLAQILTAVSCHLSSPCQTYTNTSTGPGLQGVSTSGKGLIGQTKFNSTSTSNGQAGVQGQDISTSGTNDAGVKGTSTRGAGVSGTSSSGSGVSGVSTSGAGVVAQSTNAQGLRAKSINSNGIDASTDSPTALGGRSAVFGHDDSNDGGHLNKGLAGFSDFGIGVLGTSFNWVGVNAVGGFQNLDHQFPAVSVVGNGSDLIDACRPGTANPCDNFNSIFRVDSGGGVELSGGISDTGSSGFITGGSYVISGSGEFIKNGNCVAGCPTPAPFATSVRRVRTYAAQSSQPTVEDYGEAQLVGGQAYVHLDPAFANVIDQHARYLVVVTPEGDSNGLYVTQKTLSGFIVRENRGGKSSFAFTYRVETRPFGATEARLPMIDEPLRARHMNARPWHPGTLVPVH